MSLGKAIALCAIFAAACSAQPRISTSNGDVIVQTGPDGRFGIRHSDGTTTYANEPQSETISAVAQAMQLGYNINRDVQQIDDLASVRRELGAAIENATRFSSSEQTRMLSQYTQMLVDVNLHTNQTIQNALTELRDEASSTIMTLNQTVAALQRQFLERVEASERLTNASLEAMNRTFQTPITYYTQVGRRTCTTPQGGPSVARIYTGYLWGTMHDERGGGTQNLCLRDDASIRGQIGGAGNRNGQDERDAIVPLRAESSEYTCDNCILRNVNSRIPSCSTCVVQSQCFEVVGENGCPAGYHTMYSGFLYGAYRGHYGNNERTCIDKGGEMSDWPNTGYYAGHIYPTMNRPNMGNRNIRQATACHYCCK